MATTKEGGVYAHEVSDPEAEGGKRLEYHNAEGQKLDQDEAEAAAKDIEKAHDPKAVKAGFKMETDRVPTASETEDEDEDDNEPEDRANRRSGGPTGAASGQ
jgi:hypothetical protein